MYCPTVADDRVIILIIIISILLKPGIIVYFIENRLGYLGFRKSKMEQASIFISHRIDDHALLCGLFCSDMFSLTFIHHALNYLRKCRILHGVCCRSAVPSMRASVYIIEYPSRIFSMCNDAGHSMPIVEIFYEMILYRLLLLKQ